MNYVEGVDYIDMLNLVNRLSEEKLYKGCVKVVATQIGEIAIVPKDKVGNWMNNLIVTFKSLHFRFEPIIDEEK